MPLINCKVELSVSWIERCVLTAAADANKATFKIVDAKRYVPIVTLSAEDNTKLSKLLTKGFKISVYWNKYKIIDNISVHIDNNNEEKPIGQLLDSSYQGLKRFFVLTYNNKDDDNKVSIDSYKKYFLPRVKIENYNIEIDGKNFRISQLTTQLSNTAKSEKYQQDKVMITQLVVYWILLILKKITD